MAIHGGAEVADRVGKEEGHETPGVPPLRVGGIRLDHPAKWERILWGKVAPFLVLGNIAINPFPKATAVSEITFYTALALLIYYFYRYRDWSALKTPLTLPVVLFTAWACAGLFWALDFSASVHDIRSHLVRYIFLFILLRVFINSLPKWHLLFWTIIVTVMISGFMDMYSFYVVGKHSLLDRLLIPYHQSPVGPMGFMALFGVALVIYLLRVHKGGVHHYPLILCGAGLSLIVFVTQMRSLVAALPFVILSLFSDNKKRLIAALLTLTIGLLLFSFQVRSFNDKGSNSERLTINYMSLLIIKAHPVMGTGFGITPPNHPSLDYKALRGQVPQRFRYADANYNSHHNSWLGLAVRLGWVGLFLFTAIMVQGFRMCLRAMGDRGEHRLLGQLCLGLLVLFSIYGLLNEVFQHLLEVLFCVSFAVTAWVFCETKQRHFDETPGQVNP